jgi:hypothetical protein
MFFSLLLALNSFAASPACVSFLRDEVTEMEKMNGNPNITCKVKVLGESLPEEPSETCALVVEYSYTCKPGSIRNTGSGCCPR